MSHDEGNGRGRRDHLVLDRRLPADADAPGTARALVQELLIGIDGEVGGRRGDVIIAVSELVSNAVLHGPPGEVALHVELDGSSVRIEVSDQGSGPFTWPLAFGSGGHWGLSLVRALSDRAGIDRAPTNCAWCEIDLAA